MPHFGCCDQIGRAHIAVYLFQRVGTEQSRAANQSHRLINQGSRHFHQFIAAEMEIALILQIARVRRFERAKGVIGDVSQ
jgi:hypothetical protein